MPSFHDFITNTESSLKCAALVAAALFFLYKLKTGWLILNMSVTIRTRRRRLSKQRDHLAITVALDKGSTDSVYLRDIQLRISPMIDGVPILDLAKICKAHGFAPIAEMENGQADWAGFVRRGEIAISPGEKTEYGAYAEIDRKQVYFVEAAVLGQNWWYKLWFSHFVQWRASTVSLPGDE